MPLSVPDDDMMQQQQAADRSAARKPRAITVSTLDADARVRAIARAARMARQLWRERRLRPLAMTSADAPADEIEIKAPAEQATANKAARRNP